MPDPLPLSVALSELIALRGFARSRADTDLQDAWAKAAGSDWAAVTRPIRITRNVLQVDVRSPGVLGELTAFHTADLLLKFNAAAPHLKVKSLKFKLGTK